MNYTESYIIVWHRGDKDLYLHHEEWGFLDAGGHKVKKESTGYFTENIQEAHIYKDEFKASWVASGYPDTEVIKI